MIKQRNIPNVLSLIYVLFLVACFVGWVMNIVKLFKTESFEFSGVVILQAVGIFIAPIGVIMGYLV